MRTPQEIFSTRMQDSGTVCTLVSSALLQTVLAAPDEVINMKAFLNKEQTPDNEKFTIKEMELSSTSPVWNQMCQIQQSE